MRKIIVLITLTLLLALSVYGGYRMLQVPTAIREYESLCKYSHKGQFSYIVHLKPNILYNTTELRGEEGGTYFTALTKTLDITFHYAFTCNPPADTTGNLTLSATLEAKGYEKALWKKQIPVTPNTAPLSPTGEAAIKFTLNTTEIRDLIEKIEKETGSHSSEQNLMVQAHVETTARTINNVINEKFNQTLTLTLNRDMIKVDDRLEETKPGSIIQSKLITREWVVIQQSMFVSAVIALSSAIAATAIIMQKKAKSMKEVAQKKFGDILVEGRKEEKTIILTSLEDIGKVADVLAKPVLREGDSYRVYDDSITYEFKP